MVGFDSLQEDFEDGPSMADIQSPSETSHNFDEDSRFFTAGQHSNNLRIDTAVAGTPMGLGVKERDKVSKCSSVYRLVWFRLLSLENAALHRFWMK
jgi:hypothetical protein